MSSNWSRQAICKIKYISLSANVYTYIEGNFYSGALADLYPVRI